MSSISSQALAGVTPPDVREAIITEVWPSIAANRLGRALGRLYALPIPFGLFCAVATLPLPLFLFAGTLFQRYSLTTLHVRVRKGLAGKNAEQVSLADLDDVRLVERPGQGFYHAADLELVSQGRVALTLRGVPNPEAFQHNILAARDALMQVRAANQAERAAAVTA